MTGACKTPEIVKLFTYKPFPVVVNNPETFKLPLTLSFPPTFKVPIVPKLVKEELEKY